MSLALPAFAVTIESTGSSVIEKGDLRSAYSNALDNAILGSIRTYYKRTNEEGGKMPDVSAEYTKFVKSYKILSRKVSGYTASVRIAADLDALSLQDAKIFISNPVNTAVFVFSGISDKILSYDELSRIINKALTAKKFSTFEQTNFTYGISDMANNNQVTKQFKNNYSHYLFRFTFNPSFDKLEDMDNSCELTTTTGIQSRDGQAKILKIETDSVKLNEKACMSEAVTKAVSATIDYIRTNLIEIPGQNKEMSVFRIKAVNFTNMVGTNNFISALKERGFINNYKAVSFSAKEIVFEVESYFTEDELESKLQTITTDDMNFTHSIDSDGILLDFTPKEILPSDTISELSND